MSEDLEKCAFQAQEMAKEIKDKLVKAEAEIERLVTGSTKLAFEHTRLKMKFCEMNAKFEKAKVALKRINNWADAIDCGPDIKQWSGECLKGLE